MKWEVARMHQPRKNKSDPTENTLKDSFCSRMDPCCMTSQLPSIYSYRGYRLSDLRSRRLQSVIPSLVLCISSCSPSPEPHFLFSLAPVAQTLAPFLAGGKSKRCWIRAGRLSLWWEQVQGWRADVGSPVRASPSRGDDWGDWSRMLLEMSHFLLVSVVRHSDMAVDERVSVQWVAISLKGKVCVCVWMCAPVLSLPSDNCPRVVDAMKRTSFLLMQSR